MNIGKKKDELIKEYNELTMAIAEANKKALILQGKIEQIVEIEELLSNNATEIPSETEA